MVEYPKPVLQLLGEMDGYIRFTGGALEFGEVERLAGRKGFEVGPSVTRTKVSHTYVPPIFYVDGHVHGHVGVCAHTAHPYLTTPINTQPPHARPAPPKK